MANVMGQGVNREKSVEDFDYEQAFSRNIGWLTAEEQQRLRGKRVAIAGLGGVGGFHLLTLARLGVGAFHLADFDHFSLVNFNRQAGATLSSLGRPKAEVMAALARDINPELNLRIFPEGVTADNVTDFLTGVDLYVDGLDFFAFAARELVFEACDRLGVPAVTAAPLGMGTALLNFLPGKMTFEEYFRLEGLPEEEKALRFLIGLAPAALQRRYLVEPGAVDLAARRGPSTVMACQLCAGVAATEALKILLERGPVRAAPWGLQFDAYRNRFTRTWRPGGMRNPLQRLLLVLTRRRLAAYAAARPPEEPAPTTVMEKILELARWAPSGDNTQPWRFEIRDERHLVIHGFDTREDCVYDLDGHASQLAIGALLETLSLAASRFGLRAEVRRRLDSPETRPTFDVELVPEAQPAPHPLADFIRQRSVHRRAFSTKPLTDGQKRALTDAAAPECEVVWLEGWGKRGRVARLLFDNAKLRLTLPEAYRVHRAVIEWKSRFSVDKVPDQAVGLDPLTLRLTQWVMASWERVQFFNRFLLGTLPPRLELDLLPGLFCAAHFALLLPKPPSGIDAYLAAGRAVQRFWLTATKLGLRLQPEMTPLIFARYAREGRSFSQSPHALPAAREIATRLEALLGSGTSRAVFLGRIGNAPPPRARSLRLPLPALLTRGAGRKDRT